MAACFRTLTARSWLGALGAVPLVPLLDRSHQRPLGCEEKVFRSAVCVENQHHTADTRKITFTLQDGTPWTRQGAIANVLVRVQAAGKVETGCCACCKCPQPCGCPKKANGCCACCKCPDTCGCPKQSAPPAVAAPAAGCCACCTCPPPCACPKTANGCCACCKCAGTCSCPKKEAPSSSKAARPYNPLYADSDSQITLLVKRYPDSKVGGALHDLKPGEAVEVRGPNQQWQFQEGKYTEYAMVAGGTGLTPLIQCAGHVLAKDAAAKVKLVTFNKTADDVLLKAELAQLQKVFPGRLKVVHVVEAVEGRPTKELLQKLLPSPKGGKVLVMVCGRKEMTQEIAGAKAKDFSQGELGGMLKELGFDKEHVWKDRVLRSALGHLNISKSFLYSVDRDKLIDLFCARALIQVSFGIKPKDLFQDKLNIRSTQELFAYAKNMYASDSAGMGFWVQWAHASACSEGAWHILGVFEAEQSSTLRVQLGRLATAKQFRLEKLALASVARRHSVNMAADRILESELAEFSIVCAVVEIAGRLHTVMLLYEEPGAPLRSCQELWQDMWLVGPDDDVSLEQVLKELELSDEPPTSRYRNVHKLTWTRLNRARWPQNGSLAWTPTWGFQKPLPPSALSPENSSIVSSSSGSFRRSARAERSGGSSECQLLHKRLQAALGLSALDAMVLVQRSRVTVDGHIQSKDRWVEAGEDVAVNGHRLEELSNLALLVHKPVGFALTEGDSLRRPTYTQLLPDPSLVARPVGRVDIGSSGLLVLTNNSKLIVALGGESGPAAQIKRGENGKRGSVAPLAATFLLRLREPLRPIQLAVLQTSAPYGSGWTPELVEEVDLQSAFGRETEFSDHDHEETGQELQSQPVVKLLPSEGARWKQLPGGLGEGLPGEGEPESFLALLDRRPDTLTAALEPTSRLREPSRQPLEHILRVVLPGGTAAQMRRALAFVASAPALRICCIRLGALALDEPDLLSPGDMRQLSDDEVASIIASDEEKKLCASLLALEDARSLSEDAASAASHASAALVESSASVPGILGLRGAMPSVEGSDASGTAHRSLQPVGQNEVTACTATTATTTATAQTTSTTKTKTAAAATTTKTAATTPTPTTTTTPTSSTVASDVAPGKTCKCGSQSHQRTNHKLCPLNPKTRLPKTP
ncbi:unnamed protein product [Polarella glacialis]|uniref:FAD-binding FR-type domain-containing protein n=1 Tax=Polarella glacialis TaxID=89957 RepID=A0A813JNI7_POLGL|nr:unnamed protein product [Polarella glacialis]